MYQSIKKTINARSIKSFLKVAALSVFGIMNIKAEMSQLTVVGLTVGVLLVGFVGAFIWGRMGSGNEA